MNMRIRHKPIMLALLDNCMLKKQNRPVITLIPYGKEGALLCLAEEKERSIR